MTSEHKKRAGSWQKEEMRIDDGAGDPLPPLDEPVADDEVIHADVVAIDPVAGEVAVAHAEAELPDKSQRDVPGWSKEEMRIDDGAGDPLPPPGGPGGARPADPDAMPESESGFSGERSNPGGGERFGEFDDTGSERR